MGNKQKRIKNEIETSSFQKYNFDFLYIIGKGGFGKVWKVNSKKLKKFIALKEMSKAKIIDKHSEQAVEYEKELLSRINHPFIINMEFAFQDHYNLYIGLELLNGGDLRYHLSKRKTFTEEESKFFIASILLALEYLHYNNLLHRDLKPENLVFDDNGYLKLTDFGIAKYYKENNSNETSGTPGYMAPEVISGSNHTYAVDYFALGVMCYEFIFGKRPYIGKSRREIREKMLTKQVKLNISDLPSGWSPEAADFINKLLVRKASNRLGLFGASEVKEHKWLRDYKWIDLYEKKIISPFIPLGIDNFDAKYCNQIEKITEQTKIRYEKYLNDLKYQDLFKTFNFNKEDNTEIIEFINPHLIINEKVNETELKSERINDEIQKAVKSIMNANSQNKSNTYLIKQYQSKLTKTKIAYGNKKKNSTVINKQENTNNDSKSKEKIRNQSFSFISSGNGNNYSRVNASVNMSMSKLDNSIFMISDNIEKKDEVNNITNKKYLLADEKSISTIIINKENNKTNDIFYNKIKNKKNLIINKYINNSHAKLEDY